MVFSISSSSFNLSRPMEFRYRAGEEGGPSSSSSSNRYFAEQALQAGFAIGSSALIPPRMPRVDALLEELRKEQIREELIAREFAYRRMLEEEIRRELELERLLAERLEEERFLPLEMEASCGFGVGERLRSGIVPPCPEIREDERPPSLEMRRYWDFRMDERPVPQFGDRYGDVGAFERPPAPQKTMIGKMGLSKLLSKPGISGSKDNKLSDHNVSGVKRKAATDQPRPVKKEWSCSLCHVSATSQKTLNVHLKGKKHKAKEALLTNNKATSKKTNASSSMEKEGDVPLDTSVKNPTKNIDTEVKKLQNKWSNAVWCDLCKVKCNSPAMLDCHLKGKKHKAQLESKKGDPVGTAEVVKEVTNQKEELKAEDNTEATDHKGKEEKENAEVDAKANEH